MNSKNRWLISFCLVCCITFFNCLSVFAATVSSFSYFGISTYYVNSGVFDPNSCKNILFIEYKSPLTSNRSYEIVYNYDSNLNLTSVTNSYGDVMVGLPNGSYTFSGNVDDKFNINDFGNVQAVIKRSNVVDIYTIKGSCTDNGSVIRQGTSAETGTQTRPSDSDILNYNWDGDGIHIYNLKDGMSVSGYLDQSLKYFDIETYGKFTYQGDNTFFTSYAYKKMQTSIQLASVVTYGDMTRHSGEGLGIKEFQWVSDTSHLNKGDEIRFRIVYQVPMLDKGVYNIKIGTTYNNGLGDIYFSDSVNNINFLNSNWNYGESMDNSGETGNVGNEPGNAPRDDSTTSSSNPYTDMQYILTMLSSFSGFIGSLFGFLPTEVKYMFVGVCTIIVALMVKRAVL